MLDDLIILLGLNTGTSMSSNRFDYYSPPTTCSLSCPAKKGNVVHVRPNIGFDLRPGSAKESVAL